MNSCPCCSAPLLRHIRHNSIYWFCSRCHQEMPALEALNTSLHQEFQLVRSLSDLFPKPVLMGIGR